MKKTSSLLSKATSLATFGALLLGATLTTAHAQGAGPQGTRLCSPENQHCTFSGAQPVSFGANGQFVTVNKANGTDCNLAAFGADPLPGVAKACFVPASAPQPAVALNHDSLQSATYAILPPAIQGGESLINGDQRAAVLSAMSRDSAGAIKRRYPNAQFTADVNAPGVVRVTPLLVAPTALVPWANLQGQLIFESGGQKLVAQDNFNLLTVYNHRADAANFVFDQLAQRLP